MSEFDGDLSDYEFEVHEFSQISDLGFEDLEMNRYGEFILPIAQVNALLKVHSFSTLNHAIGLIVELSEVDIRLYKAIELASWPGFRAFMIAQLRVVIGNEDFLEVLKWAADNPGFNWKDAYLRFPEPWHKFGVPSHENIGKVRGLVETLDSIRKDGKTTPMGIHFLGRAVGILGWTD